MSTWGDRVSAEAWDGLVADIVALGPGPAEDDVLRILLAKLWQVEEITLDEDNR